MNSRSFFGNKKPVIRRGCEVDDFILDPHVCRILQLLEKNLHC